MKNEEIVDKSNLELNYIFTRKLMLGNLGKHKSELNSQDVQDKNVLTHLRGKRFPSPVIYEMYKEIRNFYL